MSTSLARRTALRLFAIACPACAVQAATPSASAPHATPHWGYAGAEGPEHWGSMAPDYRVCSLGQQQTPVDLVEAVRAAPAGSPAGPLGAVSPEWREIGGRILNNGHTIQVNCDPGNATHIAGARYDLLQFHFHHPAEHLLEGTRHDLECHFVHRAASGALAVLGVFIRPGAANAELEKVFRAMPAAAGPERPLGASLVPAALLPGQRGYFRYHGSLTTPPCSEGVTWTMYRTPIEASAEQIRRFAVLFANNARPVQPLHRRFLIETN